MEIIPAIDLRQGKCVRLYQGDYTRETVFSPQPAAVALGWQAQGARRLHIVDLDGAAKGDICHLPIIRDIVMAVQIPIQFGGGVRRLGTVRRLFNLGIGRVILGTAAVQDPGLVAKICRSFGGAIIVSIDAQDGYVASHGWQVRSTLTASEVMKGMAALGVRRFIYTDISRDGTLSGPNFEAIARIVAETSLPIIAAGGISSLAHLKRMAEIGVEGVIVGRALYTGDINLEEALEAVAQGD